MTVRVTCIHCGQVSNASERLSGKRSQCPKCRGEVTIPFALHDADRNEKEKEKENEKAHKPSSHGHMADDPLTSPRKKADHHDLIDMTAMVDIVFFLLIYFLVTSFVALAAAIPAPSTSSTVGKVARDPSSPTPEGLALTVKIDSDDVVWIEQEAVFGPAEIYSRLKSARTELEAERLRVAASSEATHGKMVLVLDAGVNAGFTSAQLVLEESP